MVLQHPFIEFSTLLIRVKIYPERDTHFMQYICLVLLQRISWIEMHKFIALYNVPMRVSKNVIESDLLGSLTYSIH